MSKKEFFKKVFSRYTSVGLSLMGIYNIALLALYFMHRLDKMPENRILFGTDIVLVLGVTLTGFVLELFHYIKHRKSRPDEAGSEIEKTLRGENPMSARKRGHAGREAP